MKEKNFQGAQSPLIFTDNGERKEEERRRREEERGKEGGNKSWR